MPLDAGQQHREPADDGFGPADHLHDDDRSEQHLLPVDRRRPRSLILLGSTHVDCSSGDFAGFARILWGEGSSLALGTSEWSYFEHNASPGGSCGTTRTAHPTWGGLKTIYR